MPDAVNLFGHRREILRSLLANERSAPCQQQDRNGLTRRQLPQ